ncbi:hypothetical protein M8C13_05475 [Crossiella sp. SN42]|uniref:hypothetical protein n=1 Tax=Crossiella sp. SN42 TaxID=2944808 RepID=UPI00207D1F37|nr:hypothetical protein [Crossiella sp. SN42]MCO1575209.1 hypothetical protein [Crossiella sp. SN42]
MHAHPKATAQPRRARRWLSRCVAVAAAVVFVVLSTAVPALAAPPTDLNQVIERIRLALLVLGGALVGLFITIGFLRYITSDGEEGEVARAKKSIRNAGIGFIGTAIAQLIVKILQSVVS